MTPLKRPVEMMATHLCGQVQGHHVDVLGEIFPLALNIFNLGLATECAVRSDFSCNLRHFERECRKTIHHGVDGVFQIQNLALCFDADSFAQITPRDCSRNRCYFPDLCCEIHGHAVDILRKVLPSPFHVVHSSLTAQASLGSDLLGDLCNFPGELL